MKDRKDKQYLVWIGRLKVYKVIAPNAGQAKTKGARMYIKDYPLARLGTAADVTRRYKLSVKRVY